MREHESPAEHDDTELAEIVAEIGERLQRGESVRPEDYDHYAGTLEDLLPAIRMMADLPGAAAPVGELGRLGDFRLVREVSRGGMGVVYEAVQVSLGRRVALKVLPSAAALDPRHLQRFQVEAQAAASLNHPHIVPVFATGSAEDVPYYAMQFIDGHDLARVIRDRRQDQQAVDGADGRVPGPLAPPSTQKDAYAREAARLAMQAARALDHAHANDVLHRDIKPSNLLIDGAGRLWITDFGLARVRGGLDLTHTGDAMGTPRYMSPEQALGRRTPLDGRTDIYSLGVTLYELLTLRPAFAGDDRLEILRRIAQDPPIPPRRLDPTIPHDLETIVLKAMAKSPADRYATAGDLAGDLGRFLGNRPILARRPSLADRGAKWMLRHRGLFASLAGAAGLIAVTLAYAGWQYTAILRDHNAALEAAVARADQHARDSDRMRRLADRHAYAYSLRLAGQAVETRQFETAQDLLESIPIGPDGEDPRGFSWRYLHRLARRELVRLPEQDADIMGLSLSADGRTAASLHKDSSIVIWDLPAELPRLRIVESGSRSLAKVCLTSDGRGVVATSIPRAAVRIHDLRILDATTGQLRATRTAVHAPLREHIQDQEEIHLLDGERRGACVWLDDAGRRSIRIWTLDLGPEEERPCVELDGIDAVAFASAGPWFATREGGRLTLRDVSTGAAVREFPGEFAGDGTLALSGDGRMLATASSRDGILIRDLVDRENRWRFDVRAPIVTLAFDPAARTLAAVDQDGRIHLCDRSSGRARAFSPDELDRRRDGVNLGFSADGALLATTSHGSPGGRQPIAVWDVKSARRLGTLPCRSQGASALCFAPDGRSLIVDVDRAPRIWRFRPLAEPPALVGHADEAWAVAYATDGALLATGSDDGPEEPQTIKLWDPATGRLVRGWHGGTGTVASLAFSPDGRILASGHLAFQDNVRLWDVSTGCLLATLHGHRDFVRSVAFAPDGRALATGGGKLSEGGQDWTVRLWDVTTTRCVRQLEGHSDVVRSLAFSPDGRNLATASNDRTVRLWDVATGGLLRTWSGPARLVALTFAPGGTTLAAADDTGMVTIHDATNLNVRTTIRRADSEVQLNLALAPDGQSLATCGLSGTIRLLDMLTGQELLRLPGHKAQANGLAFAPDGSSLASCSHDGEVKVWRAGRAPAR